MPEHLLHQLAWRLAATPRRPFDAALDDPTRLRDWAPARVPGTVQRDLMRAGRLPDLYQLSDLDEALREVDEQDWWYCAELPPLQAQQRAWLRFDGIDYLAAITLNGEELGRGAGMFAPRTWEVTQRLQQGPGQLAVRIWGGGALPRWPRSWRLRLARTLGNALQGGIPAFKDRLLTLKAPVHFGWDFAPRLLAVGIWDDVRLHIAGAVAFRDVWARADWGAEQGLALRLELDAAQETAVHLHASLAPANFKGEPVQERGWELQLRPGVQSISILWQDARCRPWDAPERGFPHLYRLHLRLEAAGEVVDEQETKLGARTIGWEKGFGAGRVRLNGRPLPLRGANWTPLDLLRGDEQEEQRYRYLLEAASAAGVNAIRVWGGGGRERKAFYDLCDELGLLVWQEMPIACVFFDHMPQDAGFLALVRQETRGIIRHLRGHPSVFVWGGGNEWGPGRHRKLAAAMAETAAQEDPSRRWLPASPGPGDSHQWEVWHGKAPFERYARERAPLLSEFGLAAPPDAATLAKILPPEQLWPPGPAWLQRKAELDKLWHYARPFLSEHRPPAEPTAPLPSLEAFVAAAQEAQARGLQAGIEAYRLREDAVGAFLWQWNEPWPAICWSVLPYAGPPKRAYHQIRQSYAPLAPLARISETGIELWVVNDALATPGACVLTVWLDDALLWRGEVTPRPGRTKAAQIKRPARTNPDRPLAFTRLQLRLQGQGVDARNDYLLGPTLRAARTAPVLAWLRARVKQWLLRW